MIDHELYQSLTDELRAAIRQRDAADPDAPPWEAEAHARRLEGLLDALLDGQDLRSRPAIGVAEAH